MGQRGNEKMNIKMKYILQIILVSILSGLIISGCSKLEDNITPAEKVSVHKEGYTSKSSSNFHGLLIKNNNWDMKDCQQCHAADYSGGLTKASCITCHTSSAGPEACNTCHGNFGDPMRIAPPRDINGDTATSVMGVGAHANHLYDHTLSSFVSCNDCHKVPTSVYEAGHLDSNLPAEVSLSNLAVANIASNASYNAADGSCANTYCHGNFEFDKTDAAAQDTFIFVSDKIIGNNKTVSWTKVDGTQAKCGTCHGTSESIAPEGHLQLPINACFNCHGDVVDENGNIIDQTKHINGIINARDQ